MMAVIGPEKVSSDQVKAWLTAHRHLIPIYGIVTTDLEGVARAVREWAPENGILLTVHEANRKRFGRCADRYRNQVIANCCGSAIAFWDARDWSTLDIIRKCVEVGKCVRIVALEGLLG